jgi:hypothetical protein
MRRIKVLGKQLSPTEVEAVQRLLAEVECSPEEIEVVESLGEPTPSCDDEIIILLMSTAACSDPNLDEELAKTPNGGRRVICIWPGDGSEPAIEPDAVGKYAYSIVPWDAEKLKTAVTDDDVLTFETASGAARPEVDTERNLCVGEKAAAK